MDQRGLTDWFMRLQPRELVEVLRDFLGAEANRTGGGIGDVHFSTQIYTPDGGVDGRTKLAASARQWFLPGAKTWQVKSGKTFSLDEVDKPETQNDIAEGCDYVLGWALDDPITNDRDATENALTERIQKKHPGRRAHVVTIPDFIRMAQSYPSVVQRHQGPALAGWPLEQWAPSLQVDEYPYIADEPRTELIVAIRDFCSASDPSATHLHVVGDTGVGKSRLVYEALNMDGLKQLAVVTPDYALIRIDEIQRATEPKDAKLVLVVDDVTAAQIDSLKTVAASARGRLRLITIGDRGADRTVIPDQRRLDLAPLTKASMRELLAEQGLSDSNVDLIENLAQGYPRLAVEIGYAFRLAPAARTTADLLAVADVHTLLGEMIPEPQLRESLSVLSLFERVGFDGEVATELKIVAQQFGLDPLKLRHHVRQETGRFVSAAGRYRRVTPLALGVWLVRELLREKPTTVVDSIVKLPDTLAAAFRRQLGVLGGDPHVEDVLEEVANQQAHRFREPDGQLTELGASFLHSLAYGSPELAGRLMAQQLEDSGPEFLRAQQPSVRRHLVWALTHLLWFASTFEVAADTLLRLAEAENETYGNNATEELAGVFRPRLGGTEVSYNDRLAWWDRHWESSSPEQKRVLLTCLDKALDEQEIRMGNWRGARLQPKEWHPSSIEEHLTIKREAWERLLKVVRTQPTLRDAALKMIADNIRTLASFPFSEQLLPDVVSIPDLTATERSGLDQGLQHALEYDLDRLERDGARIVEAARSTLMGSDLESRMQLLLATAPWDMSPPATGAEPPEALAGIAGELLADIPENMQILRKTVNAPESDANTTRLLGMILGDTGQGRELQHLVDDQSMRVEFCVGYVRGLSTRAPNQADEHVRIWIDQGRYDEAIYLIDALEATPDRVQLALDAADRGRDAGVPTPSIRQLAFGSWLVPLPAAAATSVIRRLADEAELHGDFASVDAAVFSLWSYLGKHDVTEELREQARRVLPLAEELEGRAGRRMSHLRNKLADQIQVDPRERLEATLQVLARDFPSSEDVDALKTVISHLGSAVIERICEWLMTLDFGASLHAEEVHILSLLIEEIGEPEVFAEIERRPTKQRARLLQYLDFNEAIPPIALQLLDSDEDSSIANELTRRFLFPGRVVWGRYSDYLVSRRVLLEPIKGDDRSLAAQQWAREVDGILTDKIETERVREDEELS